MQVLEQSGNLKDISKKDFHLTKISTSELISKCVVAIGMEIWCCHKSKIHVYNIDLELLREISTRPITRIVRVAQVNQNNVVISSENGLYTMHTSGMYIVVFTK